MEAALGHRLSLRDIRDLCSACSGVCNNSTKADLFSLIAHPDDKIGYNALRVFTHFSDEDMKWLAPRRNTLIEYVLATKHYGKRRLTLALLEHLHVSIEDVRSDYLDFCLSKINSNEPYGIRVLCLKQSFALCRFYPELIAELKNGIELMECGETSPGLISARKNILKKISKLES